MADRANDQHRHKALQGACLWTFGAVGSVVVGEVFGVPVNYPKALLPNLATTVSGVVESYVRAVSAMVEMQADRALQNLATRTQPQPFPTMP